ncbi:MAG: hypothetical protein K2J00_07770 [Bacteroidaceae bacterium]|nr:hypothetical protein [Bacteroidaceae bacterium]
MIPDFVQQTKEILQKLKIQAEATRSGWKDSVADKFYDKVIDVYDVKVEEYIEGCAGMRGYGLNDLLVFFDRQERALQELGSVESPMNVRIDISGSPIVNAWTGQRDNWSSQTAETMIPNPSNLSANDIGDIEAERDNSERMPGNVSLGRCQNCGKPLFRCECSVRRYI